MPFVIGCALNSCKSHLRASGSLLSLQRANARNYDLKALPF